MTDTEEAPPAATRPLTAEERRQRRLAKILGNPEERINRILNNGADENGKRHAPAIEGGEGYNILPNPSTTSNAVSPAADVDPTLNFSGFPNGLPEGLPAEFAQFAQFSGAGFNSMNTSQGPPRPPVKGINVPLVAVTLGLISRAIMLFSGPINIGILWAIFYVSLVSRYSAAGLNNQTRNELAAAFQAMGNGNGFEKIMNFGFQVIEFIQTTVTFAASFLLAHMILELYDFSSDYQIVL
uniref:ER membrane protein complex subunit 6 n=1 Tax=Caenorhabditis tropicalis TaxID=1561998 RepID=A0A1I7UD12_9PELO